MNLDAAIETYRVESFELIDNMEQALIELEQDTTNPELINAIFRTAHTLKGSGGLFGFDRIVGFTHQLENLLDQVRNGLLGVDAGLISLLLECADHLRNVLEPVIAGIALTPELEAHRDRLQTGLGHYLGGSVEAAGVTGSSAATNAHWHLSLRFDPSVLQHGLDPVSFFNYLNQQGEIVSLMPILDQTPGLADIDPECCYTGFELAYRSDLPQEGIESAFEFVREDCTLHLLPPASPVSAYIALIHALPEDPAGLGDVLVRLGTLTAGELAHGLSRYAAGGEVADPPALAETPEGPAVVAETAIDRHEPEAHKDHRHSDKHFIRIDGDRLQLLINLVGELVIAGANTHLLAKQAAAAPVVESAANLIRLIEEVRNIALGLQMVQIGSTFQRFQRVVHDVSHELGKEIRLTLSGGDTELDKSVVEQIGDPLMHLVRNAMDHGIEPVEERLARGKPRQGTVSLNAYHDSGSIVLEVTDDGYGLNQDRIRAKAVERGICPPDANLSAEAVYALIFEPGFSTAEKISSLSGRGVGLDVVKRNVEALRGEVQVDSEPGYGTCVRIRLPLTLAIIDGFLVRIANERYVIPMDMLVECLELDSQSREYSRRQGYLDVRGEVLPVIRLDELFGIRNKRQEHRENIAVVRYGHQRAGLIVDELLGEFQTVIKPLGALFAHLNTISGSTILGSGEVALILDIPGLIDHLLARRLP